MARPRVFVSSTYYDLKHIRASLEAFIESLGFEAILFERGNIPFHSDIALDESCYHEAENADIFVLIVGGRYGSPTSDSHHTTDQPLEEHPSITQREFNSAQERGIPTFILVDSAVRSEYQTYLQNREKEDIKYAHVDSVKIFHFLDSIFEKKINNPVFTFDKFTQIESLLREQWAGLFQDFLRSKSQQQQLSDLHSQIIELQSANETLKNYLEVVVKKINRNNSTEIIEEEKRREKERTRENKQNLELQQNSFIAYLMRHFSLSKENTISLIENPNNFQDLIKLMSDLLDQKYSIDDFKDTMLRPMPQIQYNQARSNLGKPPISFT